MQSEFAQESDVHVSRRIFLLPRTQVLGLAKTGSRVSSLDLMVNGQFQPLIESKAGQTEIWVLANVSDMAYINVQLTETKTGRHPRIAIVGQDGNPYTTVHYPPTDNGTRLLIPPASRFAIAVTIPDEGDLILEMPERSGDAKAITAPGVLYRNSGGDNPPAVLGSVSVSPSVVSYFDGFFFFISCGVFSSSSSLNRLVG